MVNTWELRWHSVEYLLQNLAEELQHAFEDDTIDFCREDAESVDDNAACSRHHRKHWQSPWRHIPKICRALLFSYLSLVLHMCIEYERSTDGDSDTAHAGEAACNVAVDIPRLPPPTVSKADEDFLRDGIEFVWGIDGIDIEELNTLFSKVAL